MSALDPLRWHEDPRARAEVERYVAAAVSGHTVSWERAARVQVTDSAGAVIWDHAVGIWWGCGVGSLYAWPATDKSAPPAIVRCCPDAAAAVRQWRQGWTGSFRPIQEPQLPRRGWRGSPEEAAWWADMQARIRAREQREARKWGGVEAWHTRRERMAEEGAEDGEEHLLPSERLEWAPGPPRGWRGAASLKGVSFRRRRS